MDEFLEQVDGSNSTQTVNSIIHHSYSTSDYETSTQSFAGKLRDTLAINIAENLPTVFLLRLSIRLSLAGWFGILWELHHHDLDELEIQYLRFYRKRDCDVRAKLKNFYDSDRTINLSNFPPAVESLFLAREQDRPPHDDVFGFPQADQLEIHKLQRTLMTKFGQPLSDKLSFSDFCG